MSGKPGRWELFRILPRAFPYLRPYRRQAILSVALMVLAATASLAQPWPLATMMDTVTGHDPPTRVLFFGVTDKHWILVIAMVAGFSITVLTHGLTVMNSYVDTKLDQKMILDLRTDLFEHAQKLSLTFHDARQTGELMSRINYQASALGAVVMAFPPIAQAFLTLVGMATIAFLLDWQITLISLSAIPFVYYATGLYGTRIVPRLQRVQSLEWQSLSIVSESMSMLRVIVSFGRERYELKRFRSQGQVAVDERVKLTVRQTAFTLGVQTATALGTALVFGFGFSAILDGRITTGTLIVLLVYVSSIYGPLEAITNTFGSLNEQLVSLRASFELLDEVPEVQEAPNAIAIARAAGAVRFEHVGFTYPGRTYTLEDVSLDVGPGQRVGIIGPTGAGKTTLMSLLIRFYDPHAGR
ncbi:MAG: hypothetical protein QOE29_1205, partial [Gaiellaceae bacterium]|nr:hypothetical protein [Gaiellaceae bacterium]